MKDPRDSESPYEVLGVSDQASFQAIEEQFMELLDDRSQMMRWEEIGAAYEELSTTGKRLVWDLFSYPVGPISASALNLANEIVNRESPEAVPGNGAKSSLASPEEALKVLEERYLSCLPMSFPD